MTDIDAVTEAAAEILKDLGMDEERQNQRSAMVLLAMLGLGPASPFSAAQRDLLGTRAIMDRIRDDFGVAYKANTRETIRRFTLHQFIQGSVVVENPDDPGRATNSPKWCYQVSETAHDVVTSYGTPSYADAVARFKDEAPTLLERQRRERDAAMVPVTLPSGAELKLTPGGQNPLIADIVEQFCPRFAPGGEVLYLGDAGDKWLINEVDRFAELGLEFDTHGKMPDVVVYLPERDWLLLLEAAASHGPVDHTRYFEMEELFGSTSSGLVFVSCFPDQATLRKYLTDIAWETEVWCADEPSHLIHFNGDRFLGPRS